MYYLITEDQFMIQSKTKSTTHKSLWAMLWTSKSPRTPVSNTKHDAKQPERLNVKLYIWEELQDLEGGRGKMTGKKSDNDKEETDDKERSRYSRKGKEKRR